MKRKINPVILFYHLLASGAMAILQANESVILVAARRNGQRFLVALNATPGVYNYIKHKSIVLDEFEPLSLYSPIDGQDLTYPANPELTQLFALNTVSEAVGTTLLAAYNGIQATKIEWQGGKTEIWGKDAPIFWKGEPSILSNQENKLGLVPNENEYICPHCHGHLKPKASVILAADGLTTGNTGLVLLSDQPGDYEYYKHRLFLLKSDEDLRLRCPICQKDLAAPGKEGMAYLIIRNPHEKDGHIFFATRNGEHATFIVRDNKIEAFGEHQHNFNHWGEMTLR